jgi:hypothetical protein
MGFTAQPISSDVHAIRGDMPKIHLELGERWSVERLEEVLARSSALRDPARRLRFIAEQFLAEHTPFEEESSLPAPADGAVRVRLESFDCITFIYHLVALSGASNLEEAARALAAIRYHGRPSNERLIRYAWSSVLKMVEYGLMRDVTSRVLDPARLAVRTVQLGVRGDGRPFLDVPGPGDPLLGETVSVPFIPTALIREVEAKLRDADVLLLVSSKDPAEYPGIVAHAVLVHRKPGDPEIYVLHSGKSPFGRSGGPPGGVRLLTYWDQEMGALRDDDRHRPFHLYLEGSPHLWQGVVVLRPSDPPARAAR